MAMHQRPHHCFAVKTDVSPGHPAVDVVNQDAVKGHNFTVRTRQFGIGSGEVDTTDNRPVFRVVGHRAYGCQFNVGEAGFFRQFTIGGVVPCFAGITEPTKRQVPPAWVHVFPVGSLVHDHLVAPVDDQHVGAAMSKSFGSHLGPSNDAQHAAVGIDLFNEFVFSAH